MEKTNQTNEAATTQETVAKDALNTLSQVPKEEFIDTLFTDKIGKCCALGHFQRLKSANPSSYESANCYDETGGPADLLRKSSRQFLSKKHNIEYADISSVNNDNDINGYNQPEIKDRVIALLTDMVEAGY